MHSGERLNKLSAQFIEYAAMRANGENGLFLELELCSNAGIIRLTNVIFDQKILHCLLRRYKMNLMNIQLAEINIGTRLNLLSIYWQLMPRHSIFWALSQLILQNLSSERQLWSLMFEKKLSYIHQEEKEILISNEILTNYSNKHFFPYLPFI